MSVEWSADEVSLSELKLWERNPKTMPKAKAQRLRAQLGARLSTSGS